MYQISLHDFIMTSDKRINKDLEKGSEEPIIAMSNFITTKATGGTLPFVRPIFTRSKKFIIILTSLELRVYLFATRQCVKSIPIDTSHVTDIYLDKEDNVWVAWSSGKSAVINLESKSVEQEIDFGIPVIKIVDMVSSDRFILVTGEPKRTVELVDVRRKIDEEGAWESSVIVSAPKYKDLSVSNSGKCFAFSSLVTPHETITVGGLDDDYKLVGNLITVKRTRVSSSIAISDEGVLAVGSQSGVIDVYYRLFDEGNKHIPPPRALKWHVDAVRALSFSLDNNYLISGGKERVLAFWQLDTNRSQLLPRLNGDILAITVDSSSELYALYLSNGELVVLSAVDLMSRLQVAGVNADFARLPQKRKKYKTITDNYKVPDFTAPYYINPLTGHSYIPTGEAATVQVYDTTQDEQISTFAVASTLQMGRVKSEALIEDPKVKHISFSPDGKWMATVDEYTPPTIDSLLSAKDKQVNLKFWKYSQASGSWALTTRVSSPHGISKSILDVVPADSSYHNGHAFLTCCENGGIRLWRPETIKELQTAKDAKNKPQGRQISWSVRKVLPPLASNSSAASIAWSTDNSMVILGFESTLYVIDAEKFEIQRVLPSILGSRVRWLKIIGNHLVVLAKTRLVVYDLVNNQCKWSIRLISSQHGDRLIDVDPLSGNIALAVNCITLPDYNHESRIFVFSTESPVPIYTTTHDTSISNIKHVPGSYYPKFRFLDTSARLVTLEIEGSGSADNSLSQSNVIDGFESSISALYSSSRHAQQPSIKSVDFDSIKETINSAAFDQVFEDTELGVASMEALFNRVMGVLSGPPSVTTQ